MRESDEDRFAAAFGLMAETLGRRDVTASLVHGYWIALRDLGIDDVERGIEAAMRECTFLPAPAEIRARCTASSAIDGAAEWETVIGRFRGRRGVPSPLASRVVALMGGWDTIGNRSEEQNDTWTRKEFLRLYEEVAGNPAAMESIADSAVDRPRLRTGPVGKPGWDRVLAAACMSIGLGELVTRRIRSADVEPRVLWDKLREVRGSPDAEEALRAWLDEHSPLPDGPERIGRIMAAVSDYMARKTSP